MIDIYHAHLVTSKIVTSKIVLPGSQTFCQTIGDLLSRAHMSYLDDSCIQFLFDKESVYLHMFCSVMLHWIISNADCRFVVTPHIQRILSEHFQLKQKASLPITSHSALETLPYTQLLQLILTPPVVFCFSMIPNFHQQTHNSQRLIVYHQDS